MTTTTCPTCAGLGHVMAVRHTGYVRQEPCPEPGCLGGEVDVEEEDE